MTYLFKILDFDHDGVLQESDFKGLGENIGIFRCLPPDSEIEKFIMKRSRDIWEGIIKFLHENDLSACNLQNWLLMWDRILSNKGEREIDVMIHNVVKDILYIFDKNQDNFIQKLEYLCLFVSLRVSIKAANFCFKTLDLNSDMLLSKDELLSAIRDFIFSDKTNSPGNMLFGNPEINKFSSRNVYFGM